MIRMLATRELREVWWMGALAGAALFLCVFDLMGFGVDLERLNFYMLQQMDELYRHPQPFLGGDLNEMLLVTGGALAICLGLWQTLGESLRKTWPYLLFRPVSRRSIVIVKLAVGTSLLLACTGLPLIVYALWAATPGTHARPFEWWMTETTFRLWFSGTAAYLAAFLFGIRDVRWFGSRWWPLVPICFISVFILEAPWFVFSGYTFVLLADAFLIAAIFFATEDRDFG